MLTVKSSEKLRGHVPIVWVSIVICLLFYCLDFFFRLAPSLVVDNLLRQYHATPLGVGAFASAFYLGYLLVQIPYGLLFDYASFRPIVILSMILCVVSFGVFIVADRYWVGYVARFLTGAASGFSFIAILYLAKKYLEPRNFSLVSGVAISLGTVAGALTEVVNVAWFSQYNWRVVFMITASVGLVFAVILMHPRLKISAERIKPDRVILQRECIKFSKNKYLMINALIGGLFYLPTTLFAMVWGIPFLQAHYHMPLSMATWGVALLFAGWGVGALIVGYVMGRMGNYLWLNVFGSIVSGLISVAILVLPLSFRGVVLPLLVLLGVFSSAQITVWRTFARLCPRNLNGYGVALTNMMIMLVAAVFHLLVGLVERYTIDANYGGGLWMMPLAFLGVCMLSFVLIVRNDRQRNCVDDGINLACNTLS